MSTHITAAIASLDAAIVSVTDKIDTDTQRYAGDYLKAEAGLAQLAKLIEARAQLENATEREQLYDLFENMGERLDAIEAYLDVSETSVDASPDGDDSAENQAL